MPANLAKAVVIQELLNADERFEDVFAEFDEKVSFLVKKFKER